MTDYTHNAQERIKCALAAQPVEEASAVAQIAIAEATLALAEQQRVANRIALAHLELQAFPTGHKIAANEPGSVWGVNQANGLRVLRKEIADAIGVAR
jgi:hypothetical protein